MSDLTQHDIILFDGVCNLCNGAVNFIIRNDKKGRFKFGALQENANKDLLEKHSVNRDYLNSIILIRKGKIYYKSRAALEIAKNLDSPWPLLYVFIIVPEVIRNPIYDWIAKNRYRWFGKKETCRLPTKIEESRFLNS